MFTEISLIVTIQGHDLHRCTYNYGKLTALVLRQESIYRWRSSRHSQYGNTVTKDRSSIGGDMLRVRRIL